MMQKQLSKTHVHAGTENLITGIKHLVASKYNCELQLNPEIQNGAIVITDIFPYAKSKIMGSYGDDFCEELRNIYKSMLPEMLKYRITSTDPTDIARIIRELCNQFINEASRRLSGVYADIKCLISEEEFESVLYRMEKNKTLEVAGRWFNFIASLTDNIGIKKLIQRDHERFKSDLGTGNYYIKLGISVPYEQRTDIIHGIAADANSSLSEANNALTAWLKELSKRRTDVTNNFPGYRMIVKDDSCYATLKPTSCLKSGVIEYVTTEQSCHEAHAYHFGDYRIDTAEPPVSGTEGFLGLITASANYKCRAVIGADKQDNRNRLRFNNIMLECIGERWKVSQSFHNEVLDALNTICNNLDYQEDIYDRTSIANYLTEVNKQFFKLFKWKFNDIKAIDFKYFMDVKSWEMVTGKRFKPNGITKPERTIGQEWLEYVIANCTDELLKEDLEVFRKYALDDPSLFEKRHGIFGVYEKAIWEGWVGDKYTRSGKGSSGSDKVYAIIDELEATLNAKANEIKQKFPGHHYELSHTRDGYCFCLKPDEDNATSQDIIDNQKVVNLNINARVHPYDLNSCEASPIAGTEGFLSTLAYAFSSRDEGGLFFDGVCKNGVAYINKVTADIYGAIRGKYNEKLSRRIEEIYRNMPEEDRVIAVKNPTPDTLKRGILALGNKLVTVAASQMHLEYCECGCFIRTDIFEKLLNQSDLNKTANISLAWFQYLESHCNDPIIKELIVTGKKDFMNCIKSKDGALACIGIRPECITDDWMKRLINQAHLDVSSREEAIEEIRNYINIFHKDLQKNYGKDIAKKFKGYYYLPMIHNGVLFPLIHDADSIFKDKWASIFGGNDTMWYRLGLCVINTSGYGTESLSSKLPIAGNENLMDAFMGRKDIYGSVILSLIKRNGSTVLAVDKVKTDSSEIPDLDNQLTKMFAGICDKFNPNSSITNREDIKNTITQLTKEVQPLLSTTFGIIKTLKLNFFMDEVSWEHMTGKKFKSNTKLLNRPERVIGQEWMEYVVANCTTNRDLQYDLKTNYSIALDDPTLFEQAHGAFGFYEDTIWNGELIDKCYDEASGDDDVSARILEDIINKFDKLLRSKTDEIRKRFPGYEYRKTHEDYYFCLVKDSDFSVGSAIIDYQELIDLNICVNLDRSNRNSYYAEYTSGTEAFGANKSLWYVEPFDYWYIAIDDVLNLGIRDITKLNVKCTKDIASAIICTLSKNQGGDGTLADIALTDDQLAMTYRISQYRVSPDDFKLLSIDKNDNITVQWRRDPELISSSVLSANALLHAF